MNSQTEEDFQRVLASIGMTESELFEVVKQQTAFLHKIPFVEYHYGENCRRPEHEDQYPILQEIHPLKRAYVEQILSSQIPDSVAKIVIFGSAVTIHCNETSDLDICIVGMRDYRDERKDPWLRNLKLGSRDVVYMKEEEYTHSDNPAFLGYQIKNNGVVIYEQQRSS